jgi:hypothetical protein
MSEVLLFLAIFGCRPSFSITHDDTLDRPARQSGSLVRVRTTDDAVLVHELVHVCQEQAHGPSATDAESARREREARAIELMWRQRDR